MLCELVTDVTSVSSAPPKSRSRVLSALLFLLLSLALFGGVFFYVGGVAGVKSLLAGVGRRSDSTAARPSISPIALDAAKYMYSEQIQSQDDIQSLIAGKMTSFTVDAVNAGSDSAIVPITAYVRDRTQAPGALRFIKRGSVWYFVSLSGLRPSRTNGFADVVASGGSLDPSLTAQQRFANMVVSETQRGVLRTLAEQQVVNQPTVRDLLSGEYKRYEVGKPVKGSKTYTIPVTVVAADETTISARIVVISAHVEGTNRYFISTFERD